MEEIQHLSDEYFLKDLQKIHAAAERSVTILNSRKEIAKKLEALDTEIRPPSEKIPLAYSQTGKILVVDDNELNRDLLLRRLEHQGHQVAAAENGEQALEMIHKDHFDVILLDIVMPRKDGYAVLKELKTDDELRHIPVIMLSALDEIDSVVRCIEMGADDYLHKPFNPVLLRARINASLEKKRLHDQEQDALRRLKAEQEKSERLLLNVLPKPIAERLKEEPTTIADHFQEVTVLFADIVGFTKLTEQISPTKLVELLNQIFSQFDQITEKYGLEKIKTVGDTYMVVGGLPTSRPDHAEAIAELALEIQEAIGQYDVTHFKERESFKMRIGIHSGPVVAGIIGTKKFSYDLWGDTVNTASRMESHAQKGSIQVTQATYDRLKQKYVLKKRGIIPVKGKGKMMTYLLQRRKS